MSDAPLPEITCDRCIAPGTCCQALHLNERFPLGTTWSDVQAWLDREKLPFVPLRPSGVWQGPKNSDGTGQWWYMQWLFNCPKLGQDGRCTIYEDRPHACRVYEPGVDQLCIHSRMQNGQPLIPQLPAEIITIK